MSLEQFYLPFAKEVSSLLPKEKPISADMIQDFMTNLSNALAKVQPIIFCVLCTKKDCKGVTVLIFY